MGKKYIQNEKVSVLLFLLVMLMYGIVYMTKMSFGASMARFEEEGILTIIQTGTISAVFYLVYTPFQIVGGLAADKFCPFRLVLIGLLGATLSNAIILITQNYYILMLTWGFNAMIQFGIWPSIFKIVSSVLAPVHRKSAVFYCTFAGTIGIILSYILAGIVSTWRSNFIVCVVSLGVMSVLWAVSTRFFKRQFVDEEYESHGVAHLPEIKPAKNEKTPGFLKMCFVSGFFVMFPALIIESMFSAGIQTVVPNMLKDSYANISVSLASILTTLPIIATILGKYAYKYIYRSKVHNDSFVLFLSMTLMLIPLSVMLSIGKINYWIILIMIVLLMGIAGGAGLVGMSYMPFHFAKVGKVATASGMVNAMASLGIVLSNYVSPRIAEKFGWKGVIIAWMIFSFIAAVNFIITTNAWKKFMNKQS